MACDIGAPCICWRNTVRLSFSQSGTLSDLLCALLVRSCSKSMPQYGGLSLLFKCTISSKQVPIHKRTSDCSACSDMHCWISA